MSNYTSKANVEKYIGQSITTDLDAYITKYLNATDIWIDNYIGRTLKDGASATKYYDCNGGMDIYIDDFESDPTVVTTLLADGSDDQTLVVDVDYYVYPPNQDRKRLLVLIEGNNRIGFWPIGRRRLKVTASFGLVTTPANIELAATMLVANILNQNLKGGTPTSEKVGDVAFAYKAINNYTDLMGVTNLLDQYRAPTI